jgi:hypothetical protein
MIFINIYLPIYYQLTALAEASASKTVHPLGCGFGKTKNDKVG